MFYDEHQPTDYPLHPPGDSPMSIRFNLRDYKTGQVVEVPQPTTPGERNALRIAIAARTTVGRRAYAS